MSAEGSVTYTVKELIGMLEKTLTAEMAKISAQLTELNVKVDSKASGVRLENLEEKVGELETKVIDLQLTRAGNVAIGGAMKLIIGTVGLFSSALIALLIWLASGGH